MAEQWLSIVEYARTFGISDMTIRRRIRTGRIQAVLRDGKYYIPTEADPMTGELRKQAQTHQQPVVHKHPVKSHPHAERTIPSRAPQHYAEPARREEIPHKKHIHATPQRQWNQPLVEPTAVQPVMMPQAHNIQATPSLQMPAASQQLRFSEADVSVEARALLQYCNATLDTTRERERLIEARYSSKIDVMNEQLKNRDVEIQKLQQQIEDLQLLVQILERKRA